RFEPPARREPAMSFSIRAHDIGTPVSAVAGKIPPAPLCQGGARSAGELSQQIMCTNLVWCDLVRRIEGHRMLEYELTICWWLVLVERDYVLGNAREIAATHEVSQCRSLGSGIDLGCPCLDHHIVEVYRSETDAGSGEPRGIGNGRMQLGAREEDDPA